MKFALRPFYYMCALSAIAGLHKWSVDLSIAVLFRRNRSDVLHDYNMPGYLLNVTLLCSGKPAFRILLLGWLLCSLTYFEP